jgi:hypothetical protein
MQRPKPAPQFDTIENKYFIREENVMPKKPHLTLATASGTRLLPANTPPRPLGEHGSRLWNAITSSYNFTDEGGRALLVECYR